MKGNRGVRRLKMGFLLGTLAASVTPVRGQEIQYKQDPDAEKRMTLLLKDWDPKPMVHLAQHDVPRAKFYVIDVHNHVNDAGGVHGDEVPAADVVKAMDQANVKKIVILTGMWGEKLQGVVNKMVKPYPDRLWCSHKWIGARSAILISVTRWFYSWMMR